MRTVQPVPCRDNTQAGALTDTQGTQPGREERMKVRKSQHITVDQMGKGSVSRNHPCWPRMMNDFIE